MSETTKNPHLGSSLDDFLIEEGILEEANAYAIKRVIAWQLQEEMKRQKVTKIEMAKRMQSPRAQLDRVLNPEEGNVTLETLFRAAQALGKNLSIQLA